eukprot:1340-Heterococcus_DN1.PRE.9
MYTLPDRVALQRSLQCCICNPPEDQEAQHIYNSHSDVKLRVSLTQLNSRGAAKQHRVHVPAIRTVATSAVQLSAALTTPAQLTRHFWR